jgi:hypothetical protein
VGSQRKSRLKNEKKTHINELPFASEYARETAGQSFTLIVSGGISVRDKSNPLGFVSVFLSERDAERRRSFTAVVLVREPDLYTLVVSSVSTSIGRRGWKERKERTSF